MSSDATADTSGGLEPLSLAERAHASQRRWATDYARAHRTRRSLSWVIAAALAAYVGFILFQLDEPDAFLSRIGLAFMMAAFPLSLIRFATLERLQGGHLNSVWVFAFIVLIGEALGSIELFNANKYATGTLYISATMSIGIVLCYGLYIPQDPSVDWDEVLTEQLCFVHTSRGGRAYERIITTYRQAEEVAAAWLRRFGYHDAQLTPDRQDDGIDVEARSAVAQVKNWVTKNVGIAEVQRLVGSAKPGQARFFFAAHGYTTAASRWAANPDHRVSLFVLRPDGNIIAWNHHAKRTLWETPFHMPVEHRKPTSPLVDLTMSLILGFSSAFFSYATVYAAIRDIDMVFTVLMGAVAACTSANFVLLARVPVSKLVKSVVFREWISFREAFMSSPSEEDRGLPPDNFVGYERDVIIRLIHIISDIGVRHRALQRSIRARVHL